MIANQLRWLLTRKITRGTKAAFGILSILCAPSSHAGHVNISHNRSIAFSKATTKTDATQATSFGFATPDGCAVGTCPPSQPLQNDSGSADIDTTVQLSNGDIYSIEGSVAESESGTCTSSTSSGFSVQYLGNQNNSAATSQTDTLTFDSFFSTACTDPTDQETVATNGSFSSDVSAASSVSEVDTVNGGQIAAFGPFKAADSSSFSSNSLTANGTPSGGINLHEEDKITFGANSAVGSYIILGNQPAPGSPNGPVVTLLDPVPLQKGVSSLLTTDTQESSSCSSSSGTAPITTCAYALANGGRIVRGVAADGVAQIVVRVPASFVGERFDFKLTDASEPAGSSFTDDDGGLATIGADALASRQAVQQELPTVEAIETMDSTGGASMPMAFAIYRSPIDFVRASTPSTDTNHSSRQVLIQVKSLDTPGAQGSAPIVVVRPPVLLIHGLWGMPSSWDYLQAPLHRGTYLTADESPFWVAALDYNKVQSKGVIGSLSTVEQQVISFLGTFRETQLVAGTQADLVAHSLGGLVSRALTLKTKESSSVGFIRASNFQRGDIHKLITINTPHLGSPLADRLVQSSAACHGVFRYATPINQSVMDLSPLSSLQQMLATSSAPQHVSVTAIFSIASSKQTSDTEQAFFTDSGLTQAVHIACQNATITAPVLLPSNGFTAVFNGQPNDLIVSVESQSAQGLGIDGAPVQVTEMENAVHSVDPVLFSFGPAILGSTIVDGKKTIDTEQSTSITDQIIKLLNSPVSSDTYVQILP